MVAHIKGVAVQGLLDTLNAFAGVTDLHEFVPDGVFHYLATRTLPTAWYPETDYRDLLLAVGQLLQHFAPPGEHKVDVWEFIGEEGAKIHFSTVYRAAMRIDDPAGALRRTAATWALFHDSGRVETHIEADERGGKARVELFDYPIAEIRVCKSTTGYLRQTLLLSGAQSARATMTACPPPGQGPVTWSVSWSV